jgi:PhnB protein
MAKKVDPRYSKQAKKVDPLHSKHYPAITPMLVVADVQAAYKYYQKAFGLKPRGILKGPDGKFIHAELKLRGSVLMLTPESTYHHLRTKAAKSLGAVHAIIYLAVNDVDKVVAKAKELGGTPLGEIKEMFWGVRRGHIIDPDGHDWMISTAIAELSQGELKKAIKAQLGSGNGTHRSR